VGYILFDFLKTIEKIDGLMLTIQGTSSGSKIPVLNLASYDFLGFSQDTSLKQVALAALDKYGCGSCGPRGFYGTIDTHLEFESAFAKFVGCAVSKFPCCPIWYFCLTFVFLCNRKIFIKF